MDLDSARLEHLLGGEELSNLRHRLRRWLEQDSRKDERTLTNVTPHERRALEGLLGLRPTRGRSIHIRLTELDAALEHAGIAPDLGAALVHLDGPLRDHRRGELARQRWTAIFACAWPENLARWLAGAHSQGLVKRLAAGNPDAAEHLLAQAATVIRALPGAGLPLSRLAAERLGDAHALDVGRPVATLVLAALRAEATTEFERARDAWASAGVLLNEMSNPALVLNLPVSADTVTGRLAAQAAEAGEPLHLSLRLLIRHRPQWRVEERIVHVSENPTVVAEAAARLGKAGAPLVCTDGMPGASQRQLLSQLNAAGARLYYHGDFDWPGITIGNLMMSRFGAQPWRFAREDFCAAPASNLALQGAPVEPCWSPDLGAAMQARGTAVHEEAVLDDLLQDLCGPDFT